MSAGSRIALIVPLLVLSGVALAVTPAIGHGVTHPHSEPQLGSQPQLHPQLSGETDDPPVTMVLDLRSNGDARWRVSTTFDLTTEADRAAFRDLAQSFEDGETSALGLQAFRQASAEAAESTDREMSIAGVDREATRENDTGRLTVAFTWTNFARTNGDEVHVDSVFETGTDGETWLPGLDAGDTLIVRAPEGYGVAAASTAPERRENRSVLEWTGPETFEAADLHAEFTGRAALTPTGTPGPAPGQSVPWPLVFALGLGGGAVVAYLLVRSRGGIDLPRGSAGNDSTPDGGGVSTDPPQGSDATAVGPDASAETETDTAGDESDDENGIDEALLSDEERVERLLERNGGRMKQATIVKETGWSNAKVSQLLSSMEDERRIDKLRIGRENLISFPDEDVAEFEE